VERGLASGMRAAYGLRVRHPCPFLATCDFTVYVRKAITYRSVVFLIFECSFVSVRGAQTEVAAGVCGRIGYEGRVWS